MTRAEGSRGRWSATLATLAVAWSLGVVGWAAFGPAYSTSSTTVRVSDGHDRVVERSAGSSTMLEEDGSWALVVLAVPVLVSLGVWVMLRRACMGPDRENGRLGLAWSAIVFLLLGCAVSVFTVGLLVFPAVCLLAAAAATVPVSAGQERRATGV